MSTLLKFWIMNFYTTWYSMGQLVPYSTTQSFPYSMSSKSAPLSSYIPTSSSLSSASLSTFPYSFPYQPNTLYLNSNINPTFASFISNDGGMLYLKRNPSSVSSSSSFALSLPSSSTPPNIFTTSNIPSFQTFSNFPSSSFSSPNFFSSGISTTEEALYLFPDESSQSQEVENARRIVATAGNFDDINDMPPDVLVALHVLDNNYVTKSLMRIHAAFHSNFDNSIGGINGPGTGTNFGLFHWILIRDYQKWVSPTWKHPGWDPIRPLPYPLFIDNKFAPIGTRTTNAPQFTWPDIFKGQRDSEFGITMNDFLTYDDLLRAIALSFHNTVHSQMGIMINSAISPTDWSAFIGWHSKIQKVVDQWLASPNGVLWKNGHLNHLAFSQTVQLQEVMNPSPFRNDGVCLSSPQLQVCKWLAAKQQFVHPL